MKIGVLVLLTPWGLVKAFTQFSQRSRYPTSFSVNDDEEFRQALEIAKQYDAEWLAKTLDYNALYNSTRLFVNKDPLHSPTPNEALTNEESLLLALGYALEDIASIKPSARTILISKKIKKPRSGVPDDWRSAEFRQRPQSGDEMPQSKAADVGKPRKAFVDEEEVDRGGVQKRRLETVVEDMDTTEVRTVVACILCL